MRSPSEVNVRKRDGIGVSSCSMGSVSGGGVGGDERNSSTADCDFLPDETLEARPRGGGESVASATAALTGRAKTTAGVGVGGAVAAPTVGYPRGWVVVRLRTPRVAKSPPGTEMGM